MISINIPIDDYIDKLFKCEKEDLVILPRKNSDIKNSVNLTLNLKDDHCGLKNIDGNIISALSDGFVNGYIEGIKDITKKLIMFDFDDDSISEITGLSYNAINKIKKEL